MRTTINIPDEYYETIKPHLGKNGFTTLNDFLLDLIRHKIVTEKDIIVPKDNCEHGYSKGLCKFGCK